MSITTYEYNSTISNLIAGQWQTQSYFVGAQLLTSQYSHSPIHTTYSDVSGFSVAAPVRVGGKTINQVDGVTTIDCGDLDFTVQGTFSAGWVAIFEMSNEVSPVPTDKLIIAIKLNEVTDLDESVTSSIKISPDGLLRIVPADYEAPPQVEVPVDNSVLTITPGKTLADPSAWVDGDVIGVTDVEIDAFKLENLSFTNGVTIWAPNTSKIVGSANNNVTSNVGTACVFINNCTNIRMIGIRVESVDSLLSGGFIVDGSDGIHIENYRAKDFKLFGVYYDNSSDIKIDGGQAFNCGQEGISCVLTVDEPQTKWRVTNNIVYNTGLRTPDTGNFYGEGIYLGSGTYPNYGPVTDVICDNNIVYNCLAEGIDCKSNVVQAEITNNYVHSLRIPYNGAITVGSENETGPAYSGTPTILIEGNKTENIDAYTGSEFTVYSHCTVGRGNVIVRDNQFLGKDFGREYGLSIYRTCKDQDNNLASVGDNSYGDIPSLSRITINEFNADLGSVDNPMEFNLTPNAGLKPVMWYDATRDSTLVKSGSNVSEWQDYSGNEYHMLQATTAEQPVWDSRQINGNQALEFSSIQFMQLLDGPQLYQDSMIFAVVDTDITSLKRWILSLQVDSTTSIGVGVNESGFWFQHNDGSSKINVSAASGASLLSAYKSGTTQYLSNGTTSATDELGTIQRAITRWAVGANIFNSSEGRLFDGAIGEIKVYDFYDSALFESEKSEISNKWGIPIVEEVPQTEIIASYNPVAWFDASDLSTLTESSGLISAWADKSGNSNDLSQSDPSLQPALDLTTINNKPSVVSDGQNWMDSASSFSGLMCIAAFVVDGDGASGEWLSLGGETDGSPAAEIRWRSPSDPQVSFSGSTLGNGQGVYGLNLGNYSEASASVFSDSNITSDQVHTVSYKYDSAFNVQRLIGRDGRFNAGVVRLLEVAWFSSDIGDQGRQNIELYLASKWGS